MNFRTRLSKQKRDEICRLQNAREEWMIPRVGTRRRAAYDALLAALERESRTASYEQRRLRCSESLHRKTEQGSSEASSRGLGNEGVVNLRTRLTKEKREELMAIYAEHGMKGVEPYAVAAGVTAKHVANIASDAGFRRQPNQRRHREDPRWGWAKQRGAVTA